MKLIKIWNKNKIHKDSIKNYNCLINKKINNKYIYALSKEELESKNNLPKINIIQNEGNLEIAKLISNLMILMQNIKMKR